MRTFSLTQKKKFMLKQIPFFATWANMSSNRRQEALIAYLFILPWLIGFIVFFLGPIIASAILSMTEWNIVGAPEWIGFQNYRTIFTNDARFLKSVQVTLTYSALYLPLEVACGIGLAVL